MCLSTGHAPMTENIHPVLSDMIGNYECLTTYNDNHALFFMKVEQLIGLNPVNWHMNRNIDMQHAAKLKKHLLTNPERKLETPFFLNYSVEDDDEPKYEIFDGWHRYTALSEIIGETPMSVSVAKRSGGHQRCPFGSSTAFPLDGEVPLSKLSSGKPAFKDKLILVNIRFEALPGELYNAFYELNKGLSVPDIFKDVAKTGENSQTLELCKTVCDQYQVGVATGCHFTGSDEPNKPNTNTMLFTKFLMAVCNKFRYTSLRHKDRLLDTLDKMNQYLASQKASLILTRKQRSKCELSGVYIFAIPGDKLLRDFA